MNVISHLKWLFVDIVCFVFFQGHIAVPYIRIIYSTKEACSVGGLVFNICELLSLKHSL